MEYFEFAAMNTLVQVGELYLIAGRVERALELFALFDHCSDKYDDGHVREYLSHYSGLPHCEDYQAAIARGRTLDVETTFQSVCEELHHMIETGGLTDAPDALTARELEILRLVAAGKTNREIARQLIYSLGTVKWYTSRIYSKLQVKNRIQAVAYARDMGLLAQ